MISLREPEGPELAGLLAWLLLRDFVSSKFKFDDIYEISLRLLGWAKFVLFFTSLPVSLQIPVLRGLSQNSVLSIISPYPSFLHFLTC
jgi:hypothetical protein